MPVRLHEGDMRDVLRVLALTDAPFDAVVTDPPYHLTSTTKRFGGAAAAPSQHGTDGLFARASRGFMGKQWDGGDIAFQAETWAAMLAVMKPGAHLVAFGGTRTFHRMAVAIEDAGFELRDTLMWLYGTGFPKSHDAGKAIEALLTTGGSAPKNLRQRDMGDDYRPHTLAGTAGYGDGRMSRGADTDRNYKAAPGLTMPEAVAWQGWGTALKPAWEPIILARKPLAKTVAANVLAHGCGALNIDGCRIPTGDTLNGGAYSGGVRAGWGDATGSLGAGAARLAPGAFAQPTDRWPANVLHDGSDEVEAAFAAFGERPGQQGRARTGGAVYGSVAMGDKRAVTNLPEPRGDTGSVSRFFYSAKATAADRAGSKHPTVKPVALMRWLVRLVTPPEGCVLDPFAGSGTTGAAAVAEGMRAVLIEREAEYAADIRRRLNLRGGVVEDLL
jgi:site-specific DNA-methyltransferase (adenine-specific)